MGAPNELCLYFFPILVILIFRVVDILVFTIYLTPANEHKVNSTELYEGC